MYSVIVGLSNSVVPATFPILSVKTLKMNTKIDLYSVSLTPEKYIMPLPRFASWKNGHAAADDFYDRRTSLVGIHTSDSTQYPMNKAFRKNTCGTNQIDDGRENKNKNKIDIRQIFYEA